MGNLCSKELDAVPAAASQQATAESTARAPVEPTPAPEPEPEPTSAPSNPPADPPATYAPSPTPAPGVKMPVVYVIYYSMYGHIKTMADAVAAGLKEAGVEAKVFRVEETLSEEVLSKMGAPAKSDDPIIDPHDLPNADGFVFGFPTRFGMFPAQMKAFFDQTGGHWMKGALVGKPASMFTSTSTLGGGQETTLMTAVTQLTHHGMIFVPIGYSNPKLMDMSEVHGGSPWGAGCLAGPDGSRQPSELELDVATHQGKHLGGIVTALCKGRQ
mmetsp:Transcript_3945/g.9948  ORF Transcript_3945/g.9948 Transcript_3945/m.9948 type:complete len:271 (-) Transcript_3945:137-949(-)